MTFSRSWAYTGAGIGVAVIDSGVAGWHDDLSYQGMSKLVQTSGGQRIARFVDFVGGLTTPYDDNGHGTHVSGIIAGNGYDTRGARAGIAPDAHLVSLRVLDQHGRGVISDVIAALDYAVANKALYNIRVINLSVGAAVTESYNTDPLTLAAKRAVDAGIVVVTAAGNLGKNARGQTQYGGDHGAGQRAVGAHGRRVEPPGHGQPRRRRDCGLQLARSDGDRLSGEAGRRGAGHRLGVARQPGKPLLRDASRALLLTGTLDLVSKPYLSLSGTSMAAPVVAGTRRADAAGEPEPDAEPRQGHHPVHRAVVLGLQRVDRRAPAS